MVLDVDMEVGAFWVVVASRVHSQFIRLSSILHFSKECLFLRGQSSFSNLEYTDQFLFGNWRIWMKVWKST